MSSKKKELRRLRGQLLNLNDPFINKLLETDTGYGDLTQEIQDFKTLLDRHEFVQKRLVVLKQLIPIPDYIKTLYVENPYSGQGCELEPDAYRLYMAIMEVYKEYTNLESKMLAAEGKKQERIMERIEKVVHAYDTMRYYFMDHWLKEHMLLID